MSVEGVHQPPPTRPAHRVTRREALGTLAACLAGDPVAAALGPAESRLATFAADVTPPLGHALMGGGIVPAREVLDPLSARGFVQLAEALKPLVPAGMTLAQMAQRWLLDFEAVSVVITGASRPEQVRANAAASALPPLGRELHKQLAEFYRTHVAHQIRGPY
jgi:hypothetical protein